jgi:hypothetical protein
MTKAESSWTEIPELQQAIYLPHPHYKEFPGAAAETIVQNKRARAKQFFDSLLAAATEKERQFYFRYVHKTKQQIAEIAALEQKSAEWKRSRVGRFTGSVLAALLGDNPYKTSEAAQNSLIVNDFDGNEATEYGSRWEEHARDIYVAQERAKIVKLVLEARAADRKTFEYAHRTFFVPPKSKNERDEQTTRWFQVTELGLVLDHDCPNLGASPDGLIWIMGRIFGVLEVFFFFFFLCFSFLLKLRVFCCGRSSAPPHESCTRSSRFTTTPSSRTPWHDFDWPLRIFLSGRRPIPRWTTWNSTRSTRLTKWTCVCTGFTSASGCQKPL